MYGENPLTSIDYSKTIFSPRWFMENLLYIVDKNGKLVKFKLNEEQNIMMNHIEFCLANDLPIRMIVLKARQIGSTTFFAAFGFWMACMNANVNYNIVAHRDDSAQNIYNKSRVFYQNLPKELRPATIQFSSEGITFNNKEGTGINSRIMFATASEDVYRSLTITYLHQSERAFFKGDIVAIDNSLNQTVAYLPRTVIVKESTANGYNWFKDEWDLAVKGKSAYTPFFFPWFIHSEYRLPVPRDFVLTEEEKELKERFNLDDEQIYWRRFTIENNCNGNVDQFKQEYPSTPEEAFIASGTSVFGADTIEKGYASCVEPKKVELKSVPMHEKLLVWKEPETFNKKEYQKKSRWNEELQEYELVDTDLVIAEHTYKTPYTIGIDTAGLGADKNQIVVVNNITLEMVARFEKENLSEELLAKVAVEIAKMYNNAMIAPETNYSPEICNYILKEGYKNIYIRENITRQDQRISGGIEYGWKTTTKTKPAMISFARSQLNENPSLIRDRDFWYEAEYFILEDREKNIMNAASGHFDDIVIATSIAMYVAKSPQAKQTYEIVKDEVQHFGVDILKRQKRKKKIPIKKGVYNNYA